VLPRAQGEKFIAANSTYRDVVRPYLVGDDVANDPRQEPSRFIIDFGLRSLEEAMEYPDALNVVRLLVKPERDKTRIRYTPKTSFATFPWPLGKLDDVGDVTGRLMARRSEICVEQSIGLTKLYNQVDEGAWKDVRELHRKLDEAVAIAYGWPKEVAHDPEATNRRLLELNRAIGAGELAYAPFEEAATGRSEAASSAADSSSAER
jgi:hypothetical protein